jgi:hypothetical protein
MGYGIFGDSADSYQKLTFLFHLIVGVWFRMNPDPYASPVPTEEKWIVSGRPCKACGSTNTSKGDSLRRRPSMILLLLLGWVFILVGYAVRKSASVCRDCGEINLYRSTGSFIAAVVLMALIVLLVIAGMAEA